MGPSLTTHEEVVRKQCVGFVRYIYILWDIHSHGAKSGFMRWRLGAGAAEIPYTLWLCGFPGYLSCRPLYYYIPVTISLLVYLFNDIDFLLFRQWTWTNTVPDYCCVLGMSVYSVYCMANGVHQSDAYY